MAAAWFNKLADSSKARAVSGGTESGKHVHPEVITAMKEAGNHASGAQPPFLADDLAASATMLITMGCGEACPTVPGVRRADWPLEDPKGKPIERVREIRDEVKSRVAELVEREGWTSSQ